MFLTQARVVSSDSDEAKFLLWKKKSFSLHGENKELILIDDTQGGIYR